MNNFLVDILTPSSIVAKDIPAENVLVPTLRGEIEVKKDHTHIVEKLNTGVVSVFGGADDPDRHFYVTSGICKILNDKIVILSNSSKEDTDIDPERAAKALANAEEILATTLSDEDLVKYRRKAERAKIRIQLAKTVKK